MPKSKLRPYMLFMITLPCEHTQSGQRQFVGQTISYPFHSNGTDEEHIMVRAVPDHPGTLIDVPVSALGQPCARYKYVQYAVVNSRIVLKDRPGYRQCFPMDMLRYDSCTPVNFTIEEHFTGPKATLTPDCGSDFMVADVTLSPAPHWSVDRWRSFGWDCVPRVTTRIVGI